MCPNACNPSSSRTPDPLGPFGARGMAEMPMLTYAPAIAAAIHNATGIWIDRFPYTPDRVSAAIHAANLTTQQQ